MNSADVREFLKTIKPTFSKYYAGKLDNKYEKSVCVYSLKSQNNRNIAIGGKENTKTKINSFSILIHWNKNYTETETISKLLYENIAESKFIDINGNKINYIEMISNEPIDLNTDDNGVYERLIDIRIYYN